MSQDSKKSTKVSRMVQLIVAKISGDDAKATALKIQGKAISLLKAQIAIKESETFSLNDKVESAAEALNNARINNGEVITNSDAYIRNLFTAEANLSNAEEALEKHQADIDFLNGELAVMQEEVDA